MYESLIDNKTWKLVALSYDKNVISRKFVYKVKEEQKHHGSLLSIYKARFFSRGFSQVEVSDYSETFVPVINFTSIHILMSIVAINDLLLHKMDVIKVILNGGQEEEV